MSKSPLIENLKKDVNLLRMELVTVDSTIDQINILVKIKRLVSLLNKEITQRKTLHDYRIAELRMAINYSRYNKGFLDEFEIMDCHGEISGWYNIIFTKKNAQELDFDTELKVQKALINSHLDNYKKQYPIYE